MTAGARDTVTTAEPTPYTSAGSRPARVAFLSDSVWPFNTGGKERRLYEITRRLAAAGVEVHVYTMKWWPGPRTLVLDGVHLHAVGKQHSLYQGERRSIRQALVFGVATIRLLGARFDVLDVDHMPYFPLFTARVVCSVRRRRLVATWHEVWGAAGWRQYLGRLAPFGTLIERWAARLPDEIVSVSAQTSDRLVRELGVRVPVHTIVPGVSLSDVDAQPAAEPRVDVLFAGRLLANKNVDLLLRAVALLRRQRPGIRCRIVGAGPELPRLIALRDELSLAGAVEFSGFVPDDEIYSVMKSTSVLALPSVREGFGCVVVEANACGVPVVTVNHPDNAARHLIASGHNGYLANVDAADLARGLAAALDAAPHLDPRSAAERAGHLRDWDEVAAAVHGTLVQHRPRQRNHGR
ncbi:glycosyltransferase family 4 protein [Actinoplanes sp. NPDC004185]